MRASAVRSYDDKHAFGEVFTCTLSLSAQTVEYSFKSRLRSPEAASLLQERERECTSSALKDLENVYVSSSFTTICMVNLN